MPSEWEKLIEQYISMDPEICHGKPCFKGTRIMVYLVLDMLADRATSEEIREAYPNLTAQHVTAALYYAARVLERRELHPDFLRETWFDAVSP